MSTMEERFDEKFGKVNFWELDTWGANTFCQEGIVGHAEDEMIEMPYTYLVAIKEFCRQEIETAKRELAEEVCVLIDKIEATSQTNTLEEWRQYKAIRNAIRDKYVLSPEERTNEEV